MMRQIDKFINSVTMYRLMHYGLLALVAVSVVLGFVGRLPYSVFELVFSVSLLGGVCYGANLIIAKILRAPVNQESAPITALILYFILPPSWSLSGIVVLTVAGVAAMASKYVFVFKKKHLFNPAAYGAVFVGLVLHSGASWWVGTLAMLPFVILLGFLIVRKLRRAALFFTFVSVSIVSVVFIGARATVGGFDLQNLGDLLFQSIASWPIVFFASVMLVEPQTTPPTRKLQMLYGALIGLLFAIPFNVGSLYSTPELALLIGNIFSFVVSPKQKLFLKFKERKTLGPDLYNFSFASSEKPHTVPGQYMEWTLPHTKPDSRGERRYFTVATAPSESNVGIGVKIIEKSSSFKRALLSLKGGDTIVASEIAGEFTLPKDASIKLAFIAGGIGITPFRSMIKSLMDTNVKRDITLFYAAPNAADFAYRDLFEEAKQKIGLKVVYLAGKFLDAETVRKETPDFATRLFYLSGPSVMVDAYEKLLTGLGVSRRAIKTDYFPGY